MKIKLYSNPVGTGWLGWIENTRNDIIAFIQLDGIVVWDW